jgi:eukaryotic-like serine/threonine-protein kinase
MNIFPNPFGCYSFRRIKNTQRVDIKLEEFNLKNSVWYNKWHSEQAKRPPRTFKMKFWIFVLLLSLMLVAYLLLKSPFTPNLELLFFRPSSPIGTGTKPEEWATLGRTSTHQRFLNENVSFKGKVRWSLEQSESVDSSPAVVDGVLYVGGNFKLFAVEARSGKTIWTRPTTGPVNTSPSVTDDLLFLGLLDGRVIALNRHSGELKWQFKTGNYIIGSSTVVDGFLYIGSGDSHLYALDAGIGTLVWKAQTRGIINQAPAVRDKIVYAGSDSGKLYSLGASTGVRRLEFFLPSRIIDTPVISQNMVYSTTSDGRLVAIKHKSRQYPWSHSVQVVWIQLWMLGFPVPPPPLQSGTLWGTFPKEKKGRFISSPVVADGRLFLGDDRGRFYALDAQKGTPLWVIDVEDGVATAPLLLGETVYFGTKGGVLYGLNRLDGSPRWKFSLGSPLKGELVYGAGMLFVRTTNGILQAIE